MAQINADEITQLLKEQISNYDSKVKVDEVGTIISLGDGIARIHGLDKVMAGELIEFPHGIAGLAMNLEEDQVGSVLLGDYTEVREGDQVKRTGKILSVPVGDAMIGRVVNSLGHPIDDRGPIATTQTGTAIFRTIGLIWNFSAHQKRFPAIVSPNSDCRSGRRRCCQAVRRVSRQIFRVEMREMSGPKPTVQLAPRLVL